MNEQNRQFQADMMIKVCGMSDERNVRDVATLYPMLMGFIFWKKSKRCAGNLDPEIVKNLPKFIRPVGVFVNEAHDVALATLRRYGIRIVQLHGDESPEECSTFRTEGYVVIKAIGVSAAADITAAARYRGCVDMLLFDTKSSGHGGTGRKFDHAILDDYPLDIPYLLSGGIAPGDAAKIASHLYPGMVGIDINSRFESAPGIKDIALLTNFIINLRKYNEYEPSRIPFWEQAK